MADAEFMETDDPRWQTFLNSVSHDFYHLPDYVRLSARYEGGHPCAYWGRVGETEVLIPLIVKPIPAAVAGKDSCYDAFSPYGYPGPLIKGNDVRASLVAQLLRGLGELGAAHGMATAFIRLHPLLNPDKHDLQYEALGKVLDHGETVYIDLTQSEEARNGQLRKSHRYEIRRLKKQGYRIELNNFQRLARFIELYYQTMERVGAGRQYYFPSDYFRELRSALGDDLVLCCAIAPDGAVASAALFTQCRGIVQYHLSASCEEHKRLSPAKLIIDHMTKWSVARGHHRFHLGGGYGVGSDPLLKFKAGFSNLRASYRSWRFVLDDALYRRLASRAATLGVSDREYFPVYRAAKNCHSMAG